MMIAVFSTVPLIAFICIYVLTRYVSKDYKKAVRLAADVTTIFLIISVSVGLEVTLSFSVWWMIFLLLILFMALFIILQWKFQEEVVFRQAFKRFWRFSFLLFTLLYILTVIFGIWHEIVIG
ncbi:DUF3397 family protein [Salinibacillus xinjiangensis]|uniref:DUF3397 family protein n=2 Tax=Salinibacillus xinjiangensis TaxID=1229268 RepID=A0A6G1X3C9_9BACI|nr:DUF3397 family protein [Salinibacillus xinjiangensis]